MAEKTPREAVVAELRRIYGLPAVDLEDADAILSALTSAGYTVEQGWQPIETAPKDGTPILAVLSDKPNERDWRGRTVVLRHPGLAPDGFDVGWSLAGPAGIGGFTDDYVKCWRHLPAPPAEKDNA